MKKIFFLLLIVSKSFSQAGTFDITFDTDGIQNFCSVDNLEFNPKNAAIQSTGKIIQFGLSTNNSVSNLIRYNTDGSIDSSFGSNGILPLPYNSLFQGMGSIRDFALQSDDKILIIGNYSLGTYVARLFPDGTLDLSFNGVGYMSFDFSNFSEDIGKIIMQADGKILVCGSYGNGFSTTQAFFAVARITTNGVLDTTFGSGGEAVLANFSISINSNHFARSMAMQPDGKIIVGGITKNDTTQANVFVMVRFNANGSLDTTFGTGGKVVTSNINASQFGISKLLVQPDGKIVAGGLSPRMTMVRYLANGALDSSFGNNGVVFETELSSSSCDVVLQPDGKLLLAGGTSTVSFKIFRYSATGVLDSTFANNANVFPSTYGWASSVLLQNDLKILVLGNNYTSDFSHLCAVVIRLNNDVLGTEGFSKNEVGVFPNPVQNQLSITNEEDIEYELFTILGAKIQAGSLAVHGQVDCSGLAKGLYLLKLNKDNGESKVVKVVKD